MADFGPKKKQKGKSQRQKSQRKRPKATSPHRETNRKEKQYKQIPLQNRQQSSNTHARRHHPIDIILFHTSSAPSSFRCVAVAIRATRLGPRLNPLQSISTIEIIQTIQIPQTIIPNRVFRPPSMRRTRQHPLVRPSFRMLSMILN